MYLPPWARFCLRCPSWGRRRAGASAIAPAPPRQTRPWPRVTCHLSSVAWWQVITVTFGGSTVSWHYSASRSTFQRKHESQKHYIDILLCCSGCWWCWWQLWPRTIITTQHQLEREGADPGPGPGLRRRADHGSSAYRGAELQQHSHSRGMGSDKRSQRVPHMEPNF